ncbi:hypothetical protein NEIG_01858 [Nematocida sp. ERTm5]|nr:hypothetical protein NEIG_01858 [Nematocida sp. ERTm5]
MANTNKASEDDRQREPLLQKDAAVERISPSDTLSLMHGWRFVPDEIELKKRMLYALTVGFECLSIWVYKQIVPYMDKYGGEDFETTIFPKLLKGHTQSKYALVEIRQEIERNIVVLVNRIYGKHAGRFFGEKIDKEAMKDLCSDNSEKDTNSIRVLYCLLQLLLTEIEEIDIRTIELIVCLAQALDSRIYDYLTSYFNKEKDLLLEILLIKMNHREMGFPKKNLLTEKDIQNIFGELEKVSYTEKEEEQLTKKIILELSKETEVEACMFFMVHALVYINCCKSDEEILQKIIDKLDNKNRVIRGQCVVILRSCHQHKGVIDALIKASNDPDDDIKRQIRVALSEATSDSKGKREELINHYINWLSENETDYIMHLTGVLTAAKSTNHTKHMELYQKYCNGLEKLPIMIQTHFLSGIINVFSLYINPEDLIKEEIKEMAIDDKKSGIEFPSPELSQKIEIHSYTPENAVTDLERILFSLIQTEEILIPVIKILPKMKELLRSSFLIKVLLVLYEKDPKRNWRYWSYLLSTTEELKEVITGASKERIIEHIKRLTKHWANIIRNTAERTSKVFE